MAKKMTGGVPSPEWQWIIWSFVWLVCIGLYVIFFYQLYNPDNGLSGQHNGAVGKYYSFIVLILLNSLFGAFIFYLFNNPEFEGFTYTLYEKIENFGIYQNTFQTNLSNIIQSDNGILLRLFVGIFMLGYLTEFITLIIVLAVFGYGFQNKMLPNEKDNHEMNSHNVEILDRYTDFLLYLRYALFIMLFFFVYHYLNPTTSSSQNIIRNMMLIAASIAMVVCGIFQYYYSIQFLQIKLNRRDLFIGVPPAT
jgi:hypothetical protein